VLSATGSAASANPMRFSTKYQDSESGLYYYGFRYYNPNTGSWLNRDLIIEPDMNLYSFALNNPLSNFDPFGLITCKITEEQISYRKLQREHPDMLGDVAADAQAHLSIMYKRDKCGGGKSRAIDYSAQCDATIRYAAKTQKKIEETKATLIRQGKGAHTIQQHEELHIKNFELNFTAIEDKYRDFSYKCVCDVCYDAWEKSLSATWNYYHLQAKYDNLTLEINDYPPIYRLQKSLEREKLREPMKRLMLEMAVAWQDKEKAC
jgi:RHS repeat-associated protein